MSNIPKAIALVSAIAGANLLAFSLHLKPAESLDCFQPFRDGAATIQQWRNRLHPSEQGQPSAIPARLAPVTPVAPATTRSQGSTAPGGKITPFGMTQAQIDAEVEWDRQQRYSGKRLKDQRLQIEGLQRSA